MRAWRKDLTKSSYLHNRESFTGISGNFSSNPNYGWILMYGSSDCSGEATSITSYVLDTCLTTSSSKSIFYYCENGTLKNKIYTTTASCASGGPVSTNTYLASCDYYMVAGCYNNATAGPYDKYVDGLYVTQTYYATNTCNTSEIINTKGEINGNCHPNTSGGSTLYDWPILETFSNADCNGSPDSSTILSTTCQLSNEYNTIDYQTYSNFSLQGVAAPTFAPTKSSPGSDDDAFSAIGGVGGLAGIIIAGLTTIGVVAGIFIYIFHFRSGGKGKLKSPLLTGADH